MYIKKTGTCYDNTIARFCFQSQLYEFVPGCVLDVFIECFTIVSRSSIVSTLLHTTPAADVSVFDVNFL